jgi:beta-lactamase class A
MNGRSWAHKTGTINGMVGDTGIVDMPSGKRFVVTVLAQRPAEDDRAQDMIRQICGALYDYLKQPPTQLAQPPVSSPTVANPSQSPL